MTGQLAVPISKRELFYQELKRVLLNLYDPAMLNSSVILDWISLENRAHNSFVLQDLIIQSIEDLKPNLKIPSSIKSRRNYQILRQRYVEQLNQEEIAANLSISTRQVQREEKIAREVLLDYLWTYYHLDDKPVPATLRKPLQQLEQPGLLEAQDAYQSIRQELNRLTGSIPKTQITLAQEILQVINTLEPFIQRMGVEFKLELNALIPPVQAHEPVLHQAFTHLLMNTAQVCAGKPILIETEQQDEEVKVKISGVKVLLEMDASLEASFKLAADMFRMCGGDLQNPDISGEDTYFEIIVSFQAEKQLPVMIVDDNTDALILFQRYLEGSAYQPTLIQLPQRAVETAVQLKPKAIIIDVMMPDQDGWILLSQLRKHPETEHIPVIISTILPQRELAFTLGVDDFLQKPVNQAQLLETLDRVVNLADRGPGQAP